MRLQPKAFELLRLLVEARPKALGKDEILAAVWPGTFVGDNSLATVVRDLRIALDDDAQQPRFIRTVFGYGYAFVGDASPLPAHRAAAPEAAAGISSWRLDPRHREIVLREGANVLGRIGPRRAGVRLPHRLSPPRRRSRRRRAATVEDLGSKNGTSIGTDRVSGPVALSDGHELRLGSVVAVARFLNDADSTQTAVSWQ